MATAATAPENGLPATPESVVVRFAGDSGDGMQLTGGQFTLSTALAGNDLATFPDFPAEIRAPVGTTFGVSAFQINFGGRKIKTVGDELDVLVAMNPAALKVNLGDLKPGGLIIADNGTFNDKNLRKAGYEENPLENGSLANFKLLSVDMSKMTLEAVKEFGVTTFQAEDEIAAVCAAIGASYAGQLGVTSSSGPGIALKTEAIGLGIMTELPLVIVNSQRGGPSTGLPTKTEQADLMQAIYGRNGEAPIPVIAPQSSADCFWAAIEAVKMALTYMTPVLLLSDGYLGNGAEPFRIPETSELPEIPVRHATDVENFQPYARDPETLARPWAIPGTPGLEHRIGGLESANGSGNISYEPKNHDLMVRLRHAKVAGIEVPDLEVDDPTGDAELLLLGWGSSYGPIGEACRRARRKGIKVAHAQLRNLNPFPANLGEVLGRYSHVVVPEMNLGQLALLLRGKYLIDIQSVTKVEGMAFLADEVEGIIDSALDGTLGDKELEKTKFARLAAATVDGAVGANS